MRIQYILIAALIALCNCQDENSEDIFEVPLLKDGQNDDDLPNMPINTAREDTNEGSDSFQTSTEMIEMSGSNSSSDASLEVKPVEKTSVFSPITPLNAETGIEGMFNFSKATFEIDSKEDDEDESHEETVGTTISMISDTEKNTTEDEMIMTTTPLDVITFSSIPIVVDEVADRRVLKEKELTQVKTTSKNNVIQSTTPKIEVASDPSEIADENETPFDQSAFEGLFEQDGSVIDRTLSTDASPAFPILKMAEEDSRIISNVRKQSEMESTTTMHVAEETTTKVMEKTTEKVSEMTETMSQTSATTQTESTTSETSVETSEETTTLSATTTYSEEPTTSAEVASHPSLVNSSKVFLPAKAIRTPISFRITSLEYSNDFDDIESGPSKKLAKSIVPHISEFISTIAGEDNLVNVEIKSFAKGSVIVTADLLTKRSLGDAQMAVNLFEANVSRNNSILGEYKLDNLSIIVDGMSSQAYIDSISTQTSSSSLSSLTFIIISLSIVVIVAVALLVIFMMTRKKRQSTMKLSIDDTMRSITPESNETPHSVHLMSYGTAQRNSQKPPSPISKTQIDETNSAMY